MNESEESSVVEEQQREVGAEGGSVDSGQAFVLVDGELDRAIDAAIAALPAVGAEEEVAAAPLNLSTLADKEEGELADKEEGELSDGTVSSSSSIEVLHTCDSFLKAADPAELAEDEAEEEEEERAPNLFKSEQQPAREPPPGRPGMGAPGRPRQAGGVPAASSLAAQKTCLRIDGRLRALSARGEGGAQYFNIKQAC